MHELHVGSVFQMWGVMMGVEKTGSLMGKYEQSIRGE